MRQAFPCDDVGNFMTLNHIVLVFVQCCGRGFENMYRFLINRCDMGTWLWYSETRIYYKSADRLLSWNFSRYLQYKYWKISPGALLELLFRYSYWVLSFNFLFRYSYSVLPLNFFFDIHTQWLATNSTWYVSNVFFMCDLKRNTMAFMAVAPKV